MSEVEIGEVDWQRAHEELIRLARCRGEMDFEEGEWMLVALRTGAHAALGFASFAEYAERHLGYKPRWTAERLRVAEALGSLHLVGGARAHAGGHYQDRGRVAEAHRGPPSPPDRAHGGRARAGGAARRSPGSEEGEARAPLRGDRGGARAVPRGSEQAPPGRRRSARRRRAAASGGASGTRSSSDVGRASYQIAVNVCGHCGGGSIQGAGEAIDVAPEVVAMACCDAQHIGDVSSAHVGAPVRAKQEIPPATRRLVERRDGGRCVVPGCRSSVWVDIHHVDPRAEGGSHDPDGLAITCCAHHRAVHEGRLVIEGTASSGFRFFHADGTAYGQGVSPQRADLATKVFRALRASGFKETESRRAIAEARAHVGPNASVEELLRAALGAAASRAAA